ncbi:hypothetical protein BGW38_009641 [Lunasporangiospora selenospora]|uniref:Elongation of fatty acids protein n=1 Tax=Lunasporangiospora selenospora TaxID=979761 RepID=A0A9P6KID3_9FUNG|nr:hypothetical protein BGW38_009641 [Lunasporangiospora selenospora]
MATIKFTATTPQDFFMDVARAVGVAAAPYIDPIEEAIVDQLEKHVPTVVHHVRGFLTAVESPLARELPLMNPFHVLVISLLYLAAIFVGIQIMKNLDRFEAKTFSLLHNFCLVSISAYMCGGVLYEAYKGNYGLFENLADHTAKGLPMAKMIWLFYFSKIMEFVDTMIMVVKKNNRQISFLHVYHHCSIFMIWWLVTFIAPNGEAYFSAALNSFIHVIMYGYYFLSALGFKQVAFVKFYITKSQMTQFCMMSIQSMWNMYAQKVLGRPGYPFFITAMLWFYMWTMLGLFYNFYRKNSQLAKAAKAAKAAEDKNKKLQ